MKAYFLFVCLGLFFPGLLLGQDDKKIEVEYADFFDVNQNEVPDAALLTGNVRVRHQGMTLTCNKAYYFQKENYLKAFGNVQMVQGDTLFLDGRYAEYNGNVKKAFATGDVVLRSPEMRLITDTIHFDRNSQQAYYLSYGTITNRDNVLKSKSGRYFVGEKKYQFLTAVTITNPKYVIKSNHLDYYTNSGHAYLFGPSTITGKDNFIYTTKGFYDTRKNLAHLLRHSYIKYKDRKIEGDSLFYDRNREFASATRNIKITDSINRGVVRGHYAEVYRNKDSMYVTKRAVAVNFIENDSVYIHGTKLMVTGKPQNRIIRAFRQVRFYKTDMSGKCDSIYADQKIGLTKLIGKPIIWNYDNQMTGDLMHLVSDTKTEKLDSLKVLNNAFLVAKDTIGSGYNQVKGQHLFGKFKDNRLYEADILKNAEVIYYMRNEQQELIGINKNVSSKINLTLDKNKIETITFYKTVDGDIYPEKDLPENARKLRGFIWRGDERIMSKDDIFPPEENIAHQALLQQSKTEKEADNKPMKIRKETLEFDQKTKKEPEKKKGKGK